MPENLVLIPYFSDTEYQLKQVVVLFSLSGIDKYRKYFYYSTYVE